MAYLRPCYNLLKTAISKEVGSSKCLIQRQNLTARAMSTFYSAKPVPQVSHCSKNHQEMYELSLRDPDFFWGQLAASRLKWMSNFHTVRNCDVEKGRHEWFLGGQINVSGR